MTAMLSRVERSELASLRRQARWALRMIGRTEDKVCEVLGIGDGDEDQLLRDLVTDFVGDSITINRLVARVRTEQARRKP